MAKNYYHDGKLYKASEWDHDNHRPLPKAPKAKKTVEPVEVVVEETLESPTEAE